METPASRIVAKFGGLTALARAVGSPVTTVQYWKECGLIPSRHQGVVLAKAQELGIALTPADFFHGTASADDGNGPSGIRTSANGEAA